MFFWRGEGSGGVQVGCDRRIEIFGKIHKKTNWGRGGGGGVGVDVNEEFKFCENSKKKYFFLGGGVGGDGGWVGGGGSGWGGG